MVGNGKIAEFVVAIKIAAIYCHHRVVKFLVRILGHIGPYGGVEPFVAVRIEHHVCIRVAHFGDAVYNIVVRIPRVFLKVADCAEEVALSVIVLIFHFALIGDCRVVAPCAYKHHVFLAGSGDAE